MRNVQNETHHEDTAFEQIHTSPNRNKHVGNREGREAQGRAELGQARFVSSRGIHFADNKREVF